MTKRTTHVYFINLIKGIDNIFMKGVGGHTEEKRKNCLDSQISKQDMHELLARYMVGQRIQYNRGNNEK